MPRHALLLVFVACVVLGGCEKGSAIDGLLDRLPADTRQVSTIDLVTLREQLELGPAADARSERLLLGEAGIVLPHLRSPQPGTIGDVLEHGSITVAVTGLSQSAGNVTLVATTQDFQDIARPLVEAGYARDPNEDTILTTANPALNGHTYQLIADGGGGTIVLAQQENAGRAVLEDQGGGPPEDLRMLLDTLGTPVRVGSIGKGCVEGLVAGDRAGSKEATFIVRLTDDQPVPEDLVLATDSGAALIYSFDEPSVADRDISVNATTQSDGSIAGPASYLNSDEQFDRVETIYRC